MPFFKDFLSASFKSIESIIIIIIIIEAIIPSIMPFLVAITSTSSIVTRQFESGPLSDAN